MVIWYDRWFDEGRRDEAWRWLAWLQHIMGLLILMRLVPGAGEFSPRRINLFQTISMPLFLGNESRFSCLIEQKTKMWRNILSYLNIYKEPNEQSSWDRKFSQLFFRSFLSLRRSYWRLTGEGNLYHSLRFINSRIGLRDSRLVPNEIPLKGLHFFSRNKTESFAISACFHLQRR